MIAEKCSRCGEECDPRQLKSYDWGILVCPDCFDDLEEIEDYYAKLVDRYLDEIEDTG